MEPWHLPYSRGKPQKPLARRPSDEGHATSYHLKWGQFSPKEVCRGAQHVGKVEGRKEGKDEVGLLIPALETRVFLQFMSVSVFLN